MTHATSQEVAAQLREANALDWRLYVLARALLERQEAACAAEAASSSGGAVVRTAGGR